LFSVELKRPVYTNKLDVELHGLRCRLDDV